MKRPLCWICLVFMAGIWLMESLKIPDYRESSDIEIARYLQKEPQAKITGRLERKNKSIQEDRISYQIILEETNLIVQSKSYPIGNIKVYMDTPCRAPIGSLLEINGKMRSVKEARNPGEFDSRLYYAVQKIAFQMTAQNVRVLENKCHLWKNTLAEIQETMVSSLEKVGQEQSDIFAAMLWGDKSSLEEEIKIRYQMAGIVHMLAISGLHLSCIGMGVFKLLLRAGAGVAVSGTVAMLLLFCYAILTGGSIATMRALVMFVAAMGARLMGRTYDSMSALSLAVILILLENPSYLFYSGFLLSAGSILGIAWLVPRLMVIFPLRHVLFKSFLAGLGLQLFTLPLTLAFFYELPVYGVFLNLLVIPTLVVVFLFGMAGSIGGLLNIGLGKILILPGRWCLMGYDFLGKCIQQLPEPTWILGKPEKWQMAVYYLILCGSVAAVYRLKKRKKEETKKGEKAKWLPGAGVLLATVGAVGIFTLPHTTNLTITCLDMGQGDCSVIEDGQGHVYLVDGGSSNLSHVGQYKILPFLKSKGISKVDAAFISHADQDHISGILEILEMICHRETSVSIENLILPEIEEKTEGYLSLEALAKELQLPVHYAKSGQSITAEYVSFTILSPMEGGRPLDGNINDSSLVLTLEQGNFRGLFTGDIGSDTERELAPVLEQVDFLKVAHHGSRYSTEKAFLKKTKPRIAVVSSSSTNTYGHPHPDTLQRLKDVKCKVYKTMVSGAVSLSVEDDEISVMEFMEEKRYLRTREINDNMKPDGRKRRKG